MRRLGAQDLYCISSISSLQDDICEIILIIGNDRNIENSQELVFSIS